MLNLDLLKENKSVSHVSKTLFYCLGHEGYLVQKIETYWQGNLAESWLTCLDRLCWPFFLTGPRHLVFGFGCYTHDLSCHSISISELACIRSAHTCVKYGGHTLSITVIFWPFFTPYDCKLYLLLAVTTIPPPLPPRLRSYFVCGRHGIWCFDDLNG